MRDENNIFSASVDKIKHFLTHVRYQQQRNIKQETKLLYNIIMVSERLTCIQKNTLLYMMPLRIQYSRHLQCIAV